MSDPSLGGLSPQPDFHSYMESHWGFGPTPHTVQDLVAFAETGTVVDKLNEFVQIDKWDGPSTRSLSDSVVEAIGLTPKTFLALLPSFLRAKREYQYAVIEGFKKLWDAWDGKQSDFDWHDAWPKLVGFFEQILTDPAFWTEPVTDDGSLSPNRNWIPAVISEFLRAGTRTDKKAYDPALLPRTWSLTKILLKESDSEQEPSEGDALNKAINTSKGKAVEALFEPLPVKLLSALSLLSCYLKSVGARELPWLLTVAPHVSVDYNADFFIEELGRLVEMSRLQVAEVLVALLESYQPSFDFEDRLKNLVTKLAARPETRPHALRSAECLRYIPGMIQLYAQISEQ